MEQDNKQLQLPIADGEYVTVDFRNRDQMANLSASEVESAKNVLFIGDNGDTRLIAQEVLQVMSEDELHLMIQEMSPSAFAQTDQKIEVFDFKVSPRDVSLDSYKIQTAHYHASIGYESRSGAYSKPGAGQRKAKFGRYGKKKNIK